MERIEKLSELKLLPCPFCGGEVEIALTGNKGEQWFVTRGLGKNKCTCRVFMESNMFSADDSDTKEKERDKLIAKWNTRKPMANIVEKLEEESKKKHNKERDVLCKIANASYSAGVKYAINVLVLDYVKDEHGNDYSGMYLRCSIIRGICQVSSNVFCVETNNSIYELESEERECL